MNRIRKGTLVISLDFELMWGVIDVSSKDGYGQTNVKQVPKVIQRMLELFEKYDVHATFATVGMIMYSSSSALLADMPSVRPSYSDASMSPYENNYVQNISSAESSLFFLPDIVREIRSHCGMEVGTHTFCHYYCWADGQTVDQFETDISKAIEVAKCNGIEISSVVFPRNQVSEEHLKVCSKHGITSYRGNALKFFDEPKSRWEAIKLRICRLLDAYANIGGNTSVPYNRLEQKYGMVNLCASRMLRPYVSHLSLFEKLRLRRIKKELIHAAKCGEMYHLWWHPHNFGANMEENFHFLEEVLKIYKGCHEQYDMQSCTMDELRKQLTNQN